MVLFGLIIYLALPTLKYKWFVYQLKRKNQKNGFMEVEADSIQETAVPSSPSPLLKQPSEPAKNIKL